MFNEYSLDVYFKTVDKSLILDLWLMCLYPIGIILFKLLLNKGITIG